MRSSTSWAWSVGFLAALSPIAPAGAAAIGPGSFGPGSSFESFERLAIIGGANIAHPYQNVFVPGSEGPYRFSTGAILDWGPGAGGVNDGVDLIDFSLAINPAYGITTFGLGPAGTISRGSQLPDGQAFLGRGGMGSISFTFEEDMRRVGAFVTGTPGVINVSAFDIDGGLLGSHSAPAVGIDGWRDHFFGLEAEGVRRVTFTGENLVLDGLRFEAVPEPSAVVAWGAAVVALAAASRRRAGAARRP